MVRSAASAQDDASHRPANHETSVSLAAILRDAALCAALQDERCARGGVFLTKRQYSQMFMVNPLLSVMVYFL
jgi:hypothetical protein